MASTTGATALRKRRLNLSWLKPPRPDDEGAMALVDHLRELRYRVIVAALAIVVATALCLVWHEFLQRMVFRPYTQAIDLYKAAHPGADVSLVANGLSTSFMFTLKTGLYAGLVTSCPVWLYQLWAFIAPGLLSKEKKYSLMFLATGIPLFLSGVALGYWISPKGFVMLLGFTPEGVTNLQDINDFLHFLSVMLLVFGGAFLLPVILVALNLVGVLRGTTLGKYRAFGIFACFVFGAVATPSQDPFSMCALALPMALMYLVSEIICRINDKRRVERGELVLAD
ncbi:sec-independent protein translocase protein TatC [Luteococcus japonicus]|uniref:Sec-independent protein translocase protein TatC n=1 Tax=Luteococcus japonicus TaxID=33984 RepID=A0A3N1ZZG3_9ACTN|nr:twin-arginine translocase subunit TatC [Luteococcus japonicus]ROR55877.1 sec-independent protein translocase protein TatC [Luteococcus japonicus]